LITKKYFNIIILSIIIFLLVSIPISAKVDIGGELAASLISIIDDQGNITVYPQQSLDLELFLPTLNNTQAKFEIYLFNNTMSGGFDYLIKKLYLKHKFDKLHLTLGRQPISWSFGSMLNPVDFTLGAMVMDEETGAKYQDAIEAYIPLNWNSSVLLVAAFPEASQYTKWGLRGRTMIEGYDLTLNYVREPEMDFMGTIIPASQRVGFTAKGDLGPIGIYGALGYYFKDNNDGDLAYLIGGDYSYFFEAGNKIYFQLEYLSMKEERLSSLLGSLAWLDNGMDSESNTNLLLTRTSYDINEFSAVSLFTISSLNDLSTIIMPNYSNQISNNLTFNCNFTFFSGKENTLFGPGLIGGIQEKPKIIIEAGFIYSF